MFKFYIGFAWFLIGGIVGTLYATATAYERAAVTGIVIYRGKIYSVEPYQGGCE